ncbi:MAG: insulinase family protein [Polyangiaceae bacterium]|nr:insulinase family protein [Polyangiaceae bacterium]
MNRLALSSLLAGAFLACSVNPEPILVPPAPAPSAPVVSASSSAPLDPTAARPPVPPMGAFAPAPPEVFDGPGGSRVWLLSRRGLPLLALSAVSSVGAAFDGPLAGRAVMTAGMLDEGTERLDSVAFSRAIEDLGAQLQSQADREKSSVHLQVISSKFPAALDLLGAAITRPRHAEKDWKRVASLWKNDLKARGDDPATVARMATAIALWGREHPYGQPVDGTEESARSLSLRDIKAWHGVIWHPSRVTFLVAGDIDRTALEAELARAFEAWKTPAAPAPVALKAVPPGTPPRTVLIERSEAPQVVMTVARRAVAASHPDLPAMELLNIALGGSFTSRLNQNLREDHGWTYGARSAFSAMRDGGTFAARASIRTDALAPALRETLGELKKMATEGPSRDELTKIKALARADAVETYGSLQSIASTLVVNVARGLPPDHDARVLAAQEAVSLDALLPIARRAFALDDATILLVGPRDPIETALRENNLPPPVRWDAEGKPLP